MISRNALYSFVEDLIESAGVDDPLYEAESFRNLRTSIDVARKVVRVECLTGEFTFANDPKNAEVNVQSTIQCWVLPISTSETDLDEASDLSFDMAQAIHDGIAPNANLNNGVCVAEFREFETGFANLGATRRGVTYLDGIINSANEG